ncbi:DUF444 family protein [Paenibacillus tianjinensis]|uniref:DUF444 family protein n=1 Tax=Paenibacillus tianjinensis TaxID=2810347 RepID=A0ABX7L5Q7_9BACL|nr:DUF444 family protein [Paenibacillus tianjinensis]QSF43418.1 DUF444 family protein [Paenibacillus tianjinensis]
MVKIKGMKHEEIVQNLCDIYGKLKFDTENDQLKSDFKTLKETILERMSSYSIIEKMELSEVLTLEDVVVNKYQINEVFNKLNGYIKPHLINRMYENSEAIFIVMMDNSGSMGTFEKHIGRSVITWNKLFLEDKYVNVETEYIVHSTDAKSVGENQFFNESESGGTIASSAYVKCLEIINSKDYKNKDIYVMHVSDGDNLTSDNRRVENYLYDILHKVVQFQYIEPNQYNRTSTLMSCFRNIDNEKFIKTVIKDKSHVMRAIQNAFTTFE